MKRVLKVALPIVIVAAGSAAAWILIASRTKPETRIPEPPLPLVRVQEVQLQTMRLTVASQGTVSPRTESVLVPEVSGTIIEVSPSFNSGGFFEAGDLLLRIDSRDYRQALVQFRSSVTRAEVRLAQELAEADVARDEWEELGDGGEAPALTMREPQLADARAAVAAAQAALETARLDLERTEIRAPYAGRVREKRVDLGQFVNRGAALGTIYAIDYAEIRLPLPDGQLAYLDGLPLVYRGETGGRGPEVKLRSNFAGKIYEWRGRIVRTEGEIDVGSRMVHAVAQVKDPYSRGDDPDRPPLAAGMFVEAEILGREVDNVALLPRSALREGSRILVVDEDDRLRFRQVSVLRVAGRRVIIESGVRSGDRVCLSALAAVTDGMRVRTVVDDGGVSETSSSGVS